MAEDTIVIKLRDRDSLLVSKQMLVENSSVFSRIILECGHSEHDISDFTPEIVEMFLSLLEEKKVEQILQSNFRELYKISAVFSVEWLIESCGDWLLEEINNIGDVIDYDSLLFLFEECFYIYSKWNLTMLMKALILKVRFKDNSLFLSRYIRENYESTEQLQFLLHLAGSNTRVFLELIIERINSQEHLDVRTRYLLQHVDLSLCVQQNEELYHEMFGRLSELSDMSNTDLRMVFKLSTEATRDASARRNSTSSTTTVFDINEGRISLHRDRRILPDIKRLITEGKIRSMFTVIRLLEELIYYYTLSTAEMEEFVECLENLSPNKTLRRVSTHYIDMFISALKFSDSEKKHQFIQLLEMIRTSENLSSCYNNHVHLVGEKITQSTGARSVKYVFKMKHPVVTVNCIEKGDCGFIIKRGASGYTLSQEAGDYTNSGVHLHAETRADHINWYRIRTGRTREGETVRVPVRWWTEWWWWFMRVVTNSEITEYCAEYNIADSLVAKC